MSFLGLPEFWSTVTTLILVAGVFLAGLAYRKHLWMVLELGKPLAEGTGKGIEHLFRRPLPGAAPYDLLIHLFFLALLFLYFMVVLMGGYRNLAAQLPVFILIYIGTAMLSFLIAVLLDAFPLQRR